MKDQPSSNLFKDRGYSYIEVVTENLKAYSEIMQSFVLMYNNQYWPITSLTFVYQSSIHKTTIIVGCLEGSLDWLSSAIEAFVEQYNSK